MPTSMALHQALNLYPWQAIAITRHHHPLGVSEETGRFSIDPDTAQGGAELSTSYRIAARADRRGRLAELARAAYEKNLREAQARATYCAELVAHPERGGQGTGLRFCIDGRPHWKAR